jgi:predicted dehydrogenase
MSTKKTLRAAHVGISVGHAGSFDDSRPRLIHDFRRLEGVEVVAYCELYDSSFLDIAKEHNPGAGLYSSVDELIANEEFDLACVVLLPRDVPDAVLKLANAGKHFFADKQFAHKSEDLHDVVKAVRRNNLTTFLNYPWRFHPAMQDLKRLIDEGVMGDPLFVEARQVTGQVGGPHGSDPQGNAYRPDTEGGGSLHYVGCHILEAMRFLMGSEIKSVQAMTGRPMGYTDESIEDLAVLALEYADGGYGSLVSGYFNPSGVSGWGPALIYRGTEGGANWTPVGAPKIDISSASEKWSGAPEKTIDYTLPTLPSVNFSVWYFNWLQRFVEDIHAGNPGVINMTDALYVLQSIDAAYESARTGRRVEVKYDV